MSDMDEIVKEFLIESAENLDRLDRDFVALEKNPEDKALLASIFRAVHTIKGTCGFLGYSKLESVTHVGENLLGKLRDGKLLLNAERTTALLALVDAIRLMIGEIEKSGKDGNNNYDTLINSLTILQGGESSDEEIDGVEVKEMSDTTVSETSTAPTTQQTSAQATQAVETNTTSVAESAIRVDVSLLDKLMNLVGELVLSRNQILQFSSTMGGSSFANASQRLNLITSELQEGIMKTRMQPIGNVWSKFPRVVRDLASACGKKVRLEMLGKETELDKTLIEAIKDPLTHIVRNSVDHGIELPEARRFAGKTEEGVLSLKAYHEGGQVNIEITDDGGGISPDKIRDKALSKGLINADQAKQMNERDLLNLIFLPGFSTAEKITNVSGRGVGMDVVKTNIERINGVIDIQSKPGQGTTLKVKIPLTLAIIPALIVTSAANRYAIPQVNLLELVLLEGEQVKKEIQMIHGAPVYQLRGHLLPLLFLNHEFEFSTDINLNTEEINIVVLKAGEHEFGLVVDSVSDTQEIVVKPLCKLLNHVTSFAGATIMGDGKVALILDIMGLAQKAALIAADVEKNKANQAASESKQCGNRQMLLLVKAGQVPHMAIPMSQIERIEEFDSSKIEQAGNQQVIQYRDKIMPLIDVASALPERRKMKRHPVARRSDNSIIQVVVYSKNGMSMGFVVDQVFDVVEEAVILDESLRRDGVLGSAVIQNKVTEILDVERIVKIALPGLFETLAA